MKIDRATRAKNDTGGHQPGHAYMRNFNHNPKGRMHVRMGPRKHSRSHTSRS
jgi:hypothetical protein